MLTIFLSASVPLKERHPRYFETADVVAIREAVRGLALVVLPRGRIVFGGHPAITPMIRLLGQTMGIAVADHVTLYQSAFFEGQLPPDNEFFEQVVFTPASPAGLAPSLQLMRERMLGDFVFSAGVFIGGMEGVEDEYAMFREKFPDRPALPIASTGAAARIIYEREEIENPALINELAYVYLFRSLLL